jgi:ArsR family transcriptional regulator
MLIYALFVLSDNVKLFRALGDETRLTIVGYLLREEHCACDFHAVNKDQTTVSRHLKVLHEAGVVRFEKQGRKVVYRISSPEMRERLRAMGIEEQDACCPGGPPSEGQIRKAVRKRYGTIAQEGGSCGPGCCGGQSPMLISAAIGYSDEEMGAVPASNLGLGCGNPGALGDIREGETVLDLGSGSGMDAFLAARRVGPRGRVIGVDITAEMVDRARRIAQDHGLTNVEFRLGDIEDLPVEDGSVDLVLSNCVINLVPDKTRAFREAFRVLRPGGRMYISDMVLLEELSEEQRSDEGLITGCVAGAVLREEYLRLIASAGFRVERTSEDRGISKEQYKGMPVQSIKVVAARPQESGRSSR